MNHRRFLCAILFALASQVSFAKTVSLNEVMNHFGCQVNPPKTDHKCFYLKRGILRDSRRCTVDPKRVMNLTSNGSLSINSWKQVDGSINYIGFYPGRYRYWVKQGIDSEIEIRASIHFRNLKEFSSKEISSYESRIKLAAKKWNKRYGDWGKVKFIFSLERDPSKASISNVRLLKKKTRGPYFSKWSYEWSRNVIAHEFGHILGLDDEYKNGPGGGDGSVCNRGSRMCSSSGLSQNYHYYLMLRRVGC